MSKDPMKQDSPWLPGLKREQRHLSLYRLLHNRSIPPIDCLVEENVVNFYKLAKSEASCELNHIKTGYVKVIN